MTDLLNNNVDIELDGETVTLVPTLGAAMQVNKFFGGFLEADRRIKQFDLEATQIVVAFGLGKAAPKNVNELVWKTGLAKLVAPAIEFVGILANGGKRFVAEEEKPEEKPAGNAEVAEATAA